MSDLLQGRRRLLPVDDLVVTSQIDAVNNVVLQTSNSSISAQLPYAITGSVVPSFATGAGRMFNLPRDVIVTMTDGLVNIRDQDPAGFVTKGFSVSGNPRGMAMADFNGDGFADIALLTADAVGSTSGLLRIVTANDVNNLDAGLFVSNGIGPNSSISTSIFRSPQAISTGTEGGGRHRTGGPLNGGELLIYVFEVVTNPDGTIANQALRQVAASTVAINGVAETALTAGDYDGVLNANGLPDAELVIAYRFGANLAMNSSTSRRIPTIPVAIS